jgi:hypothetical protein
MLSEIKNLKGNNVSVQNDDSGTQTWIISGRWKLTGALPTSANTSTQNADFSANLTMIKIDGTGSHRHRLTDFKLSDLHSKDGIYTVSGKVTLTTQGKDEPGFQDQPIIGNPVKIQYLIWFQLLSTFIIFCSKKTSILFYSKYSELGAVFFIALLIY